ncbi:MAG: FtsQ-type POTRA domain-containing protein, partial [Anaerolineales bacterium]|nr:FtsQ-type POTRA domain-containing protein [Anaerolineales bacterium]
GQSIFTIQPGEVRERLLLNYPELLSAEVKVYLPNHVYVTVVERQPVVFWQQDGEGYTWIDASGVAFRPRGIVEGLTFVNALDAPPIPTALTNADPLSPPPYLSTDLVEAIRILAPLVPANTTLTYSAADGLSWDDPRGWRVAFGTGAKDMPLKIRIYQSLVGSLSARRITPEFISVVYPDGPYYRMAETDEINEELSVSDGQ